MKIKCPYCGAEDDDCVSDLWEIEGECNERECGSCEKTIVVNAEVSVSYIAKRSECLNDHHTYGDWYRFDYDEGFSIWSRDCEHCDESNLERVGYREGLPLGVLEREDD